MVVRWAVALALAVLAAVAASGARAENRTALVIGNGAYDASPLANAVNDATDMADALGRAGFDVLLRTDADQRAMDEAVAEFAAKLAERRGVGLFYFSGHGIRIDDDQNYLLPIGGNITHVEDVKYGALNAGRVIDAMDRSGASLNIVVLDACRNNPLQSGSRSSTRGLSRISTGGSGLFVSFSTAPGDVALDGEGRNSPYTKHLVRAITTPGLSLEGVFKETLKGVYNETGGAQVPWISSSFFGEFTFLASDGAQAAGQQTFNAPRPEGAPITETSPFGGQAPATQHATLVTREAPPLAKAGLQGLYLATGTNPNGSTYSGMTSVTDLGDGRYRFDWWIGDQRFTGSGQRDGRWIRVDWGSTSPVIYTLAYDGRLDGIWADGQASETLSVHEHAPGGPPPRIAGRYNASGTNPNGTSYSGSATIEEAGGQWRVRWTVGNSAYQGIGVLDGSLFTVDWGQPSPVVYVVRGDGSLTGLWSSGRGTEILTPAR